MVYPVGSHCFWALAPLLVWCHPPDRSKSCTFALYIFLPSSEVQLLGNKHQNTGPSSKKIAWKINILCTALGKMAILCSIIIMTNLFVKSNPCRSIAALSLWKKWILGSCALPQEKFSSNAWLLWPNHHSYSIWIIKMLRFVKFVFSKLENNEETIKLHCKLFSDIIFVSINLNCSVICTPFYVFLVFFVRNSWLKTEWTPQVVNLAPLSTF